MKTLLAAVLISASAVPAQAALLHYTLQNVVFADGGTASGAFDYDTSSSTYFKNIAITTAAVGTIPQMTYTRTSLSGSQGLGLRPSSTDYSSYFQFLLMVAPGGLAAGGTYAIDIGNTAYETTPTGSRYLSSGSVTTDAVPEPAMLGLFGLGAIGLGLSRRRKGA